MNFSPFVRLLLGIGEVTYFGRNPNPAMRLVGTAMAVLKRKCIVPKNDSHGK